MLGRQPVFGQLVGVSGLGSGQALQPGRQTGVFCADALQGTVVFFRAAAARLHRRQLALDIGNDGLGVAVNGLCAIVAGLVCLLAELAHAGSSAIDGGHGGLRAAVNGLGQRLGVRRRLPGGLAHGLDGLGIHRRRTLAQAIELGLQALQLGTGLLHVSLHAQRNVQIAISCGCHGSIPIPSISRPVNQSVA